MELLNTNEAVKEYLTECEVSQSLINDVIAFRNEYASDNDVAERISIPPSKYYGKEIWEMSLCAMLQGENLLLSGAKATGKSVLADNLSYVFARPTYTVSFNVNTDSATMIGTDTFKDNEVTLRKGPVYQCAVNGGFGVFDEINMAKNDAVSVLHATLDYRRIIDVPGYDKIRLHPATRFIGTMNYGYAGTRELNEALVSRFLVIDMPAVDEEMIRKIMTTNFPTAKIEPLMNIAGIFLDLQLKAASGEITTKPVDLRGLLSAVKTIQRGLNPISAIKMGITNKSFDAFEKEIVEDVIATRVPKDWTAENIFE
ncbi:MAG: MoxR family ATPase [Anaerofustis stercorihominis]|nr:MoxR family ATPase [Anaerofustis stercorihominis]